MGGEAQRVQGHLETVARLEPNISLIDQLAALTSIAVSLKRIADALEGQSPALIIPPSTEVAG